VWVMTIIAVNYKHLVAIMVARVEKVAREDIMAVVVVVVSATKSVKPSVNHRPIITGRLIHRMHSLCTHYYYNDNDNINE